MRRRKWVCGIGSRRSPSSAAAFMARAASRDPMEAAALGSAILHGPQAGRWRRASQRLAEARASRQVGIAADLAEALADLLSPDRAARLAQAAWAVATRRGRGDRPRGDADPRAGGGRPVKPPGFWFTPPDRPAPLAARLLAPLGALYAAAHRAAACAGRAIAPGAGDLRRQPERGRHGQDPDLHRPDRSAWPRAASRRMSCRAGYGGRTAGPLRVDPARHRAAGGGRRTAAAGGLRPDLGCARPGRGRARGRGGGRAGDPAGRRVPEPVGGQGSVAGRRRCGAGLRQRALPAGRAPARAGCGRACPRRSGAVDRGGCGAGRPSGALGRRPGAAAPAGQLRAAADRHGLAGRARAGLCRDRPAGEVLRHAARAGCRGPVGPRRWTIISRCRRR